MPHGSILRPKDGLQRSLEVTREARPTRLNRHSAMNRVHAGSRLVQVFVVRVGAGTRVVGDSQLAVKFAQECYEAPDLCVWATIGIRTVRIEPWGEAIALATVVHSALAGEHAFRDVIAERHARRLGDAGTEEEGDSSRVTHAM
jgi:hypothetical protein